MRVRSEQKFWWLAGLCGAYSALLVGSTAWGQEQQPIGVQSGEPIKAELVDEKVDPFIRIVRDADGKATAMQTATARYVSQNGRGPVAVDLIGAVHVGDKEYYESLNKQFTNYEVLLYELVAEHGTVVPKGGGDRGNSNPIGMMHSMAKSMLGLESQMEHIDYTKDNFVHADMTPGEMASAMKERGDTPLTFALSAFTDAMREQNRRAAAREAAGEDAPVDPLAEIDLISMLTDKSVGGKLKVAMAEQFGATGSLDKALGATFNQAIVVDRNKAALKVFQKELANGRRNMGIFYGAAHLPDFEKRLKEDFGMSRVKTTWTTAWDLTKEAPKQKSTPLDTLFRLLK